MLTLSAGLLREVGEVVLPQGVRRTPLYKNLVEVTLRYMIERVVSGRSRSVCSKKRAESSSVARMILYGLATFPTS